MTEPTASVYRERGRVWIRMELSEAEYETLLMATALGARSLANMLVAGEREKTDRSHLVDEEARYAPPLGDDGA